MGLYLIKFDFSHTHIQLKSKVYIHLAESAKCWYIFNWFLSLNLFLTALKYETQKMTYYSYSIMYSDTNSTSVLWDTERVLRCKTLGENFFFSDTEAFFLLRRYCIDHCFVRFPQLNQWWKKSCTAYDWKAHQNGQGIWLYNAGIRQGSSRQLSHAAA